MSETEIARLSTMVEAVHRRMDRIECSIEKTQSMLGERDDEIHVIVRDLALSNQRDSSRIDALNERIGKSEKFIDTSKQEHLSLSAQVKNMAVVFKSAQWVIAAAVLALISGAISMWLERLQ